MIDWERKLQTYGYTDSKLSWAALYDLYSVSELAKLLDTHGSTVRAKLTEHRITRRARGGPNNSRVLLLLHRLDQRVVNAPDAFHLLNYKISRSSIDRYKRRIRGVLCH